MWNFFLILCALFLVDGVSVDETIKVSVIEGDSVTLKPDDGEIQTGDTTLWKFNGLIIKSDDALEKFKLNNQSGSLTIKNIRTTDSGLYELKISKDAQEIPKNYSVTVSAVTGEMKTVSVREGDSIILHTGLYEKQGYDPILWKFGDRPIANRLLPHDSIDGERFKGRLWLYRESGDLIIRGSKSTDSGVYHLDMSSSTYSVQRNISVTVMSSGLSSTTVALIVVCVLLVCVVVTAAVGGIWYPHKIIELITRRDVEKKETNVPLNAETANTDDLQPL